MFEVAIGEFHVLSKCTASGLSPSSTIVWMRNEESHPPLTPTTQSNSLPFPAARISSAIASMRNLPAGPVGYCCSMKSLSVQ
ncbi:MAG: hypothetical protein M5U19_14395 [Microthrixaceae bacterium]|nr:hypothetical protein [Microthrixaceae bacterium]